MIKPKLLHVYHGVLTISVLVLLWFRRNAVISKDATAFDILLSAVAVALLLTPLFKEISLGGVTLKKEIEKAKEDLSGKIGELRAAFVNSVAVSPTFNVQLQELVHREVSKAQEEALRMTAEMDLQLLPLWESEHSSVPSDYNNRKLELVEARIKELETRLANAPAEEQVHFAWVLRSLYWMWLEASRTHYASSMPYQETRRNVEERLNRLSRLGKDIGSAGKM
jgi:hypothetical protein